jgi:hypothetical protein
MSRLKALMIIGICGTICSSCFKMNYSTTGASIPVEAKTVSVQYFENMARIIEAGLNQQLTDELKDYIQSNTNLTLVNGIGNCDFEGSITTYEPSKPVAITSDDQAAMNRFTIGIKIKFTCDVKPELNFETSFSRYEDYNSSNDFNQVKEDLTTIILRRLIEDVFNRAFVNW